MPGEDRISRKGLLKKEYLGLSDATTETSKDKDLKMLKGYHN